MERTFTIPSNRIYLDSLDADEVRSLKDTVYKYNNMKMRVYNQMYDMKYLSTKTENLTAWMKQEYQNIYHERLTDYYVTSLFSSASGVLSSQKELQRMYDSEFVLRQKQRMKKIDSLKKDISDLLKVKKKLVAYTKKSQRLALKPSDRTKAVLKLPASWKFQISDDADNDISFVYNKKKYTLPNLYRFELFIDKKVKMLRGRIKYILFKIDRMEKKHCTTPRRVTFGSSALYKKKDTVFLSDKQHRQWRKQWDFARNHTILFSGRHTSRYGNYQCRYIFSENRMEITLMNQDILHINHISFPYMGDGLRSCIDCPSEQRESVGYQLELRTDGNGRPFLLIKATFTIENCRLNNYTGNGVVSIDLNYDNISWSELNSNGCRINHGTVYFHIDNKKNGAVTDILGRAVAEIVQLCVDKKKPLAMENLDTQESKTKLVYGPKRRNRKFSMFAYRKLSDLIEGRAFKHNVAVLKQNPAFTSCIGKLKYMKPLGCTIHSAASYVIGRRCMGFKEKYPRVYAMIPDKYRSKHYWSTWNYLNLGTKHTNASIYKRQLPVMSDWTCIKNTVRESQTVS